MIEQSCISELHGYHILQVPERPMHLKVKKSLSHVSFGVTVTMKFV